jgi:pyruvate/2-oxoglutarate dehydrogenase complex dihydrolipoamide dehydrogenase (E3) component
LQAQARIELLRDRGAVDRCGKSGSRGRAGERFGRVTDPELARVGLNESEATSRGVNYRLATLPMAAVLRTRTLSEPRGFMKMLLATASDRILGFTAFGAEASEVMATVQTAMLGQLPFTLLRDAIFTHPTAAEGLTVLLADVAATGVALSKQ